MSCIVDFLRATAIIVQLLIAVHRAWLSKHLTKVAVHICEHMDSLAKIVINGNDLSGLVYQRDRSEMDDVERIGIAQRK